MKVCDKNFIEYISEEEIKIIVKNIAKQLDSILYDKNPFYLVMMNGAFIFASDLLRNLKTQGDLAFIKYKSYSGLNSVGKVKIDLPIPENVKDRNVVIIEDIIDTGLTMKCFLEDLKKFSPKSINVVSCFSKPTARKCEVQLDFIGKEIDDKFIVGYGLDYNQYGRTLPAVYVLDENN